MADFDTVRFPPRISMGAVGGPRFKTSVVGMASGAESRVREWETERGEWSVSYHAKTPREMGPILSFFRAIAAGQANTFRFKDWTDFECLSGEGLFIDVESSPLGRQMVKRYTFGGQTYDRVITKPISGKITTNAVDLDYATGLAASGTTWSGEFDCMCRLNTDVVRAQIIDKSVSRGFIMGWDDIEIVEVVYENR